MLGSRGAVAVALVVLVSACSGGGGGDDVAEPRTRTTTGVTADTVIVDGSMAIAGAQIGMAARFARTNRAGGVHGRRIVSQVRDRHDAPPPDPFAWVPVLGPLRPEELGGESVGTFGWAPTTGFCDRETLFAINGCQAVASSLWGSLLQLDGVPAGASVTIVGEESFAPDAAVASFEEAGYDVELVLADRTADDIIAEFADVARRVLADRTPDVVAYAGNDDLALEVGRALVGAGYEGRHTARQAYNATFAQAASEAGLEGLTVLVDFAPFESADENPQVQRLIDDVRAYEETEGLAETPLSNDVAAGYWAADAFVAALEATGPDLTVERFLQSANDDFEWVAEGTVGPALWPRDHEQPVPCGALVEVVDGGFDVAVPYSCGHVLY